MAADQHTGPPRRRPGAGLRLRMVGGILAVLAGAGLLTAGLESRLIDEALRRHSAEMVRERSGALELALVREELRVRQLVETVTQQRLVLEVGPRTVRDPDRELREVLSVVRSIDPDLRFGSVVDVTTGRVVTGLVSRTTIEDPGPLDLGEHGLTVRGSQRVVPLRGSGYGLIYTTPVRRTDDAPRLLAVGYDLDDERARDLARLTGVEAVEIVVEGRVIARSDRARQDGSVPVGDPTRGGRTQVVDDGRVVRYVSVGAARRWDTPAAIGLIEPSPVLTIQPLLAQVRRTAVVVLLAVGAVLAAALAQVMLAPVRSLAATATGIAAGDLDRGFRLRRSDELGALATALERMRQALGAQLQVIRRQTGALQEAARRTVRARDRERQRIARDLHDGIQQQLVLLRIQLGAVRAQVEAEPHRVRELTMPLAAAIDEALNDLRATGQALYPSILHDRGLPAGLYSLAARSELPVEVEVTPDPLPRLDEEVEANAYFVVSEAVVNALKHSGSPRVRVGVELDAGALHLTVRDEGVGFDRSQVGHAGGLIHLQDRVSALGGTLELTSAPGAGTTVRVRIPVGSAGGALQVEEHRGDAPVEVDLLGQAQFAEDGVGVLLDRPVGDGQLPGDGGVAPAGGHQGEDLELTRREAGQA